MARLAIAVLALLPIAGCGDDGSSSGTAAVPAVQSGAEAREREKPEVTIPDGPAPTSLQKRDLIKGSGAVAKVGDRLIIQYVGVAYEADNEFDASWDYGKPFDFTLRRSLVIDGWVKGIAGMKVGGQRELIIPPQLGYGARGALPGVQPNEAMVFVIDLLAVD